MRLLIILLSITQPFQYLVARPHFSPANSFNEKHIIICGKVEGGTENDSVTLYVKKEFIYSDIGKETLQTACSREGEFSFGLHADHPAMISLLFNGKSINLNNYYVEKGDSIYCLFNDREGNLVNFSGDGATKFSCMAELDRIRKSLGQKQPAALPKAMISKYKQVNDLAKTIMRSDQDAGILLKALNKYQTRISRSLINLLKADILGGSGRDKCYLTNFWLQKASARERDEIVRLFFSYVYADSKLTGSALFSDSYIEFLLRRCQTQLLLRRPAITSMKALYNLVSEQYEGFKKERVISSYLLRGHSGIDNKVYEWCLKKALECVTAPVYHACLQQQLNRISRGSPAYDFSLYSDENKLISLHDFRGKVTFIDFWFTGCSACKVFTDSLKKSVIPLFGDSAVVFINICLDKEKDKWLNSLKGAEYSSVRSVNLFTGGLAFEHPVAGYYNIESCPYLLIIDKEGNVFSARPSREPNELCAEINDALKK